MATGLIYDDRFLAHDTGPGHPERPARLTAIVERLKSLHLWDRLTHLEFGPADLRCVERIHSPAYVRRLKAACEAGEPFIDVPDSAICPRSYEIALLAAGGVLAAADAVMAGRVTNAFCAVRPPGHHAERDRSMGFCLFNNVAIAAQYLIDRHGLKRVAIVDIDVHHGNGTQHAFESRPDVLFVSLHEHPSYLYPGTGSGWETGEGEGQGATINIPLDPRSGDEEYRRQMVFRVLPALERFAPEAILISAGFDAAAGDPLAHLELSPRGYQWVAQRLKAAAERACGGKLISVLEGGYLLGILAECAALHVETLLQDEGVDPVMAMKAGM